MAGSLIITNLPRRGFLGRLAAMPFVGGALAFFEAPRAAAAAEPVTPELLDSYRSWLVLEYMHLGYEMRPNDSCDFGFNPNNAGARYHWRPFGHSPGPLPSTRAASVLNAVGCEWREPHRLPRGRQ